MVHKPILPKRGTLTRSQTDPDVNVSSVKKRPFFRDRSADSEVGGQEDAVSGGSQSDNEGSRSAAEDDRRSKSSTDLHDSGDSPTVSRRRKLWNSFKRKARLRSRSRSREKNSKKPSKGDSLDGDDVANSDQPASPRPLSNTDFDELFEAAEKREQEQAGDRPEQPVSRADTLPRSKSEEREKAESEADSGIAVTEHTVLNELQALRHRHAALRAHPFFLMDVVLKEGKDLVIRDSCGTSDPYVKFKIGGRQYYKSRTVYKNLNPRWEEKFTLPIEDPFKPVQVRVYDYDRGLNDDPMGGAEIDPSALDLKKTTELKLTLVDTSRKAKEHNMGHLIVQCTLQPKTQDEREQYFKRMSRTDASRKLKTQIWSSVVNVVLVKGKDLLPMDDNGFSDPYIKFRLGNERYKSKYKAKTLSPRWLEQFDLHMFDDMTSHLEISVWDHDVGGKDDIMGRAELDLGTLEPEKTHDLDVALEDGAGIINILLTISGTTGSETISDLASFNQSSDDRDKIVRKYGAARSLKGIKDIGWLQVKVIKAQGLAAADIGGKSDPFCVLELVNSRLQTQTEYKTLNPEWGKVFTFNVKDIHSVLEVTVYDEDRDKKSEFLGKIAIPILRVRNGEKRWYQMKDRKLIHRVKGAIQLEMDVVFNHFKAAIRTFNPREDKYMQPDPKFKLSVMKRNIDRVSKIAQSGVEAGKFLQSCFDWESKPRSIIAFSVFLIVTWNFELYMLPLTLLIVFIKNLLVVHIVGNLMKDKDMDEYVDEDDDDDEEEKEAAKAAQKAKEKKASKEEKKSFKEKLQAIQDVCLQVQEGMDMAASMGERVKNTFNWTIPWLSWLAVTLLTIGVFVLYHVPLRYLIMAFGINKFTKKLRAPNAIPNNELLDYLSRVPSDKELIMYRDLRPDPNIGTSKKKRS